MSSQTQTTQKTLKYLEETEFLATSIRTQKPTVNSELGDMYAEAFPEGGGPPQPDWDGLQDANLALLERSAQKLRQAESDHRRDQLRLDQLRRDRKEQVGGLKAGHRALRTSFAGTYGVESQPLVGLEAAPARNYPAFRGQVKVASTRMRDPELVEQLPPPLHGQKPIDLESLATAQDGGIEQLDRTTLAIKAMQKQADESVLAKRRAQRRHRRVYVNVARIQEGLYRLAGLDELADRIRVTEPASRQKAKETEKEAEQGEQQEQQKEQ